MVTEIPKVEKPQKPEHLIYSEVKHLIATFLIEQPEVFTEDKDYYEYAYEGYELTISKEMVNLMRRKLADHYEADIREMFKGW